MDFFIGQVCLFPWTWEIEGWARCDGRILPINANQALYSLLGDNFGGNGTYTFGLPNLPVMKDANGGELYYFISTKGLYPPRA